MVGSFGDSFFRDVLDHSGAQIRESMAPFTSSDLLAPAPLVPKQSPDPLGLGSAYGPSFTSPTTLFGGMPFLPQSFIDPAMVGTGGISLRQQQATGVAPVQSPTTPMRPQGPIAQAQARANKAGQPDQSGSSGSDLTVDTSSPYYGMAVEAAKAAGLDPEIFTRLVAQESGYRPNAESGKGARGLTQLMPDTARELGVDPFNPQQALQGGARYLKQMLDRYHGDYSLALAAYNAGPGNVDTYGGIPPFGQTQDYVRRIMAKPQGQIQSQAQVTDPNSPPTPAPGVRPLRGITTAQYGEEGLATGAADYICGPIAAQAFARSQGRNPTLRESLDMARQLGLIDPQSGMHGIESTVQLIRKLGGVASVGGIDKNTILHELDAGRPVIVDTDAGSRGHYFVIEGYDRVTGRFDFGNSALALRAARGNQYYTLEELSTLGFGSPHAAIYAR